jgi:phosphate transport system substrate-binding protein
MHDEFLHRLRKEPRPEFAARLQAQLRRESAAPLRPQAPSLVRTLITILLLGGTAFAITTVAMRGIPASIIYVYQHAVSRLAGGRSIDSSVHREGNDGIREQAHRGAGTWNVPRGEIRRNVPARVVTRAVGTSSTAAGSAGAASSSSSAAGALLGAHGLQLKAVSSWAAYPLLLETIEAANRNGGTNGTPVVQIEASLRDSDLWPPHPMCDGAASGPDIAYAFEPAGSVSSRPCFRDAPGKLGPVVAFPIAYEAVALAHSPLYGALDLTRRQIFLALAKWVPDPARPAAIQGNPNTTWRQVSPALGQEPIQLLGPPLSSPAGRSMIELLIEGGCNTYPWIAALRSTDPKRYALICRTVRTDGVYVEIPRLDAARLLMEPGAVGIFEYPLQHSSLEELSVSSLEGVQPSLRSIESGAYAGSRALYLYINRRRVPFFLLGELIAPYYGPDSAIVAPTSPDFREIVREMTAP